MAWSLTLGSIGGTAIRIHVTFLLFLIWLGAIYYRQGGAEAAWQGTIFVVLIFLCVLLHELGHVFAARRYGVNTRDVTLWPFGGIASMEQMPGPIDDGKLRLGRADQRVDGVANGRRGAQRTS